MAFFIRSRRRRGTGEPRRVFPDRHFWLVGRPEVGRSMALLSEDGNRSILTSPIERMVVADSDAIYVETRGSVYQLARAEV